MTIWELGELFYNSSLTFFARILQFDFLHTWLYPVKMLGSLIKIYMI
jgi:hypothetical protein